MNPDLRLVLVLGFPAGSDGRESTCSAGDTGSIPGSGRSFGEGHGNPLQYSCLENPMDRGAWQSPPGLKESDTTERPALAQGVQQPVRGLLCTQCSGPRVLGQMDGNPSSKSLGLTPSAPCERWFRCSLRFLLAWIFFFLFFLTCQLVS